MPFSLLPYARLRATLLCCGGLFALAACFDDEPEYDETRERGDLGNGRFVYDCFNQTDTACEDGSAELPKLLAVGGRFELRFAVESGAQPSVIAPSFDFVRRIEGGFQVRTPGQFALLAVNGNREVIDLKHLLAAEIAEVRVQKRSELPTASLRLAAGEAVELTAAPFDAFGAKLGGALDYAWSSADEALLRVESLPALNRVRVRALTSGRVALQVEVAGATHAVDVVVGTGELADAGRPRDAAVEAQSADAAPDAGAEPSDAAAEADASEPDADADAEPEEDAEPEPEPDAGDLGADAMSDQLTAKAPWTPSSAPRILRLFGVLGALAVPCLDTHGGDA
jgi:hypothetical protein